MVKGQSLHWRTGGACGEPSSLSSRRLLTLRALFHSSMIALIRTASSSSFFFCCKISAPIPNTATHTSARVTISTSSSRECPLKHPKVHRRHMLQTVPLRDFLTHSSCVRPFLCSQATEIGWGYKHPFLSLSASTTNAARTAAPVYPRTNQLRQWTAMHLFQREK